MESLMVFELLLLRHFSCLLFLGRRHRFTWGAQYKKKTAAAAAAARRREHSERDAHRSPDRAPTRHEAARDLSR